MVEAGSLGSAVKLGCIPAAMATIIVSPMAREIARVGGDDTGERGGKTTRAAVYDLVRAERVCPIAQRHRHGANRVLAQ